MRSPPFARSWSAPSSGTPSSCAPCASSSGASSAGRRPAAPRPTTLGASSRTSCPPWASATRRSPLRSRAPLPTRPLQRLSTTRRPRRRPATSARPWNCWAAARSAFGARACASPRSSPPYMAGWASCARSGRRCGCSSGNCPPRRASGSNRRPSGRPGGARPTPPACWNAWPPCSRSSRMPWSSAGSTGRSGSSGRRCPSPC
mmetsp:Transcript_44414/g.129141  ORF Transcript_44414/g.129141 Transcript_44414/m.129141 type:complete len:203 (-) Transcript_44414:521-1129(-)